MDLSIVSVGKLRPYFREAFDDYARRIQRYVTFGEREVREASRAPTVAVQRAEEAARLGAHIAAGSTLIATTRVGAGWNSTDLARQLDRWRLAARPVVVVIGGSHGLDAALVGRATARWSLGPLTLPHELARVIVIEQLYRAFTILGGEPYHKG